MAVTSASRKWTGHPVHGIRVVGPANAHHIKWTNRQAGVKVYRNLTAPACAGPLQPSHCGRNLVPLLLLNPRPSIKVRVL